MGTITAISVVYVVSLIGAWRYNRKAYSKGGIYDHLEPKALDVFFTVFPAANTLALIALFCEHMKAADHSKFFRLKK